MRALVSGTVLLELWQASRRTGALLEAHLPAPVSRDFGTYSLLRFRGPITPTELSRRSGMPPTTVSQVLKRLDRRGHLDRRPNPDDARSTTVALSPAGVAAHAAAAPAFVDLLDALHRELGPELDQVRYSLRALDRALAALSGVEPPHPPEPRPADADLQTLPYGGDPLTPAEEDEARRFVAWLRHRRTT